MKEEHLYYCISRFEIACNQAFDQVFGIRKNFDIGQHCFEQQDGNVGSVK